MPKTTIIEQHNNRLLEEIEKHLRVIRAGVSILAGLALLGAIATVAQALG